MLLNVRTVTRAIGALIITSTMAGSAQAVVIDSAVTTTQVANGGVIDLVSGGSITPASPRDDGIQARGNARPGDDGRERSPARSDPRLIRGTTAPTPEDPRAPG